ncbi:hypothetical protein GCM10028803_30810 [Larkinella knui]|uniref:Uncharacterized protein n=1 Tax=Larkinella knui TaxID=2025310 RepID=A0A3P1CYP3_9BACT|nr:hypothetical protein [Larkinella knui]RRB18106.1 hypothetical protein EHT87_07485 [Larkinella knui]
MKKYWTLIPLSLLLACGDSGNKGSTGSNDGGRRVESESDLGRFVSGSRQLSEYYKYGMPCAYVTESFLHSTFDLNEDTPITWNESETTCEASWNSKKQVSLSTTGIRPFESVFHAEYYFDSLYQPAEFAKRLQKRRHAYTGPNPEGTGAESPQPGVTASPSQGTGTTPATALNDSSRTHTGPGAPTSQLNDNEAMRAVPNSFPGMWEKAVWDNRSRTLHILDGQHVFHIMVNHGPTPAADRSKAIKLASILLGEVEVENGTEKPVY